MQTNRAFFDVFLILLFIIMLFFGFIFFIKQNNLIALKSLYLSEIAVSQNSDYSFAYYDKEKKFVFINYIIKKKDIPDKDKFSVKRLIYNGSNVKTEVFYFG